MTIHTDNFGDGTYGTSNVDKFVPRQVRIGQNESNTKLLTNIKYVAAGANSLSQIDIRHFMYGVIMITDNLVLTER